MADTDETGKDPPKDRDPPDEPVGRKGVFFLAVGFLILAVATFWLLVASWPVPAGNDKNVLAAAKFIVALPTEPDLRMFIVVIAAGTLGSLIHTLTSMADYIGNRTLSKSWVWWFILRMPIGISLALLFYLVLRGGLIVPSLPNGTNATNTTQLLNPYGVAAISAMAGMFSKQATDKLREIFDTLFRTQQPVQRADPLSGNVPVITGTNPAKVPLNHTDPIDVEGSGFKEDCKATVNGEPRVTQQVNETLIKLTLLPKDVAAAGKLKLIVQNAGAEQSSKEYTIVVGDS